MGNTFGQYLPTLGLEYIYTLYVAAPHVSCSNGADESVCLVPVSLVTVCLVTVCPVTVCLVTVSGYSVSGHEVGRAQFSS